jgi:hypothetical protein
VSGVEKTTSGPQIEAETAVAGRTVVKGRTVSGFGETSSGHQVEVETAVAGRTVENKKNLRSRTIVAVIDGGACCAGRIFVGLKRQSACVGRDTGCWRC